MRSSLFSQEILRWLVVCALADKRGKKQHATIERLCNSLSRPREDKRDLRWLSTLAATIEATAKRALFDTCASEIEARTSLSSTAPKR